MWKAGVTITDNVSVILFIHINGYYFIQIKYCAFQAFLYSLWYFTFSILGNYNNFFFAAHLLDVAVGFKTLRTILQSVTHNGKQLVLTVMLLTIIVYIYTVIAFNFFRKFYIQEEDDEVDKKCHDMATVRIIIITCDEIIKFNDLNIALMLFLLLFSTVLCIPSLQRS